MGICGKPDGVEIAGNSFVVPVVVADDASDKRGKLAELEADLLSDADVAVSPELAFELAVAVALGDEAVGIALSVDAVMVGRSV